MSFGNGYNGGRTSMVRKLDSIRYYAFWWSIDWWRIFFDFCSQHPFHFSDNNIFEPLPLDTLLILYFDLSFKKYRLRRFFWMSTISRQPMIISTRLVRSYINSIRFDSSELYYYYYYSCFYSILIWFYLPYFNNYKTLHELNWIKLNYKKGGVLTIRA
jgi:hypothetical protein